MTRRRVTLVAALLVALVGAGAAVAYWRGSGDGSGQATTATSVTVSLTPGTPAAELAPGRTADVALVMSNPQQATVRVASLALDTSRGTQGFATDAAHNGCDLTRLTFTPQNNAGAGWVVPAAAGGSNGQLAVSLAGAVAMAQDAPAACAGAPFTLYLKEGP